MKSLAIEIVDASVHYRHYPSASRSIKFELLNRKRTPSALRVALKNINLKASQGEVLGVIGKNGAGKSTLIKLIMGIVRPTNGRIVTRGSIVGILQLGAGLNMDLTGTENIRFINMIKGRTHKEYLDTASFVSDWSEIGEAINQPLRTYSSGMLARFSFALETYSTPQILIIDEVLAVGDFEFQEKSAERMKQMISSGATVILVSHDMDSIKKFCTSCIWVDQGRIVASGAPGEITSAYLDS